MRAQGPLLQLELLLDLAVGGDWPGAPTPATVFPQTFEVDYARVYQDLGSGGACRFVFDDMEQGTPLANGYFTFDGPGASGGVGATYASVPPAQGGLAALSAGWGNGGTPGYFGGFGRRAPLDLRSATHFELWIYPAAGVDATIEVNLQEDDDGDDAIPVVPDGDDDELQYALRVAPSGGEVQSGGGWQRVVVPLARFVDDDSYHFGGNGVLDPWPVGAGGNGRLVNVVLALVSHSGAPVTFTTDAWQFTRRASSLAGRVWEDTNGDGVVSFGEGGLAGVTVELVGLDQGAIVAMRGDRAPRRSRGACRPTSAARSRWGDRRRAPREGDSRARERVAGFPVRAERLVVERLPLTLEGQIAAIASDALRRSALWSAEFDTSALPGSRGHAVRRAGGVRGRRRGRVEVELAAGATARWTSAPCPWIGLATSSSGMAQFGRCRSPSESDRAAYTRGMMQLPKSAPRRGRWVARLAALIVGALIVDALIVGALIVGALAPARAQHTLVWHDEFDGSSLDPTKWEAQVGNGCPSLCGWGNNELQHYRAENAVVANGVLSLVARREAFGGAQYTSARLRTKLRGDWRYGRFEGSCDPSRAHRRNADSGAVERDV